MGALDMAMPRPGVGHGAPASPPARGSTPADAGPWRHPLPWWRRADDPRARAGAALRRRAGPRLAAGVSLAAVAQAMHLAPGDLAAAHATVFDPAESPLKARRLHAAADVLRAVRRWPGDLRASGPGWRARVRCGGGADDAAAGAAELAAGPGLQLYALQLGAADPALHWFDPDGVALWQWHPAPGHGARLDAIVRSWGRTDLRPGPMPCAAARAGTRAAALGAGCRAAEARGQPAGAGWDLLLHAAVQGLPLHLSLGTAARVQTRGVLRQVGLDGQALRLEAAAATLWLDETAVWLEGDAAGSALVGHGLCLQLAGSATRL